jgi:hypothetical protein
MRLKTKSSEIPSGHNVGVYVHNECVNWLKQLREEIKVSMRARMLAKGYRPGQAAPGLISMTADGWSADNTKAAFLGVTAHWIEVKEKKWNLRSEVVAFQGISGTHDGDNLGRYFWGLCERVGICSQNRTKVGVLMTHLILISRLVQLHAVTLDNASNNGKMCQMVQRLHQTQGLDWNAGQNQLM